MNHEIEEAPELTQDDREILSDMMFSIFQKAAEREKHVSRDEIRKELIRFFPWSHIQEVLDELEDKDFITPISTKGGGIFSSGSAYGRWAEEMAPIEYDDEGAPTAPQKELRLTAAEVEKLAGLVRRLPEAPAGTAALEKIRQALASAKNDAELLKNLSAPEGPEPAAG